MKITVTVETLNQQFKFVCRAHKSASARSRLIDPYFYEKYCAPGKIPKGVHYELELKTEVWSHQYARHIHYYVTPKTHTHPDRTFVCWTGHITDIKAARAVFRMWCLITTYTMIKGQDVAEIPGFPKAPSDIVAWMANEHHIKVLRER